MAPKIRGVIFDMDGLMFDTERIWDTFWAPCCRKLGLPEPPASFYSGGRGLAGDKLKAHIAETYGKDAGRLLDEVWAYGNEQFRKGVPCKPGLKELLAYLEQRGMPRIVASSSPKTMIECNLQTTGTARYFHDVVCGYDVDKCKPDPAIFLEAARRIGVDIHDCLVLEDSYNGVRAGHASGAVTIMVPDLMPVTDEMRSLYDACCRDLFEVREMFERGEL
ncbi:MAG: HAD family phosphatase [Gemmiger sp.]|uniref:HAD family hydrolase n=1 Tax=Gemmiger sp. TaxID=2049027 RepID=UPI002E76AA37|nr:HAD family phosphatase [Gemmiger sp.]MEE0800818.1 HAD family phosphatase [Gemmiger sp.]